MDNVLRVASKSNPNSVAGMIAALVKEGSKKICLMCIGAASVNQAIKSVATARGFLAPAGIDLKCVPAFNKLDMDGDERTGIKIIVEVS